MLYATDRALEGGPKGLPSETLGRPFPPYRYGYGPRHGYLPRVHYGYGPRYGYARRYAPAPYYGGHRVLRRYY